MLGPVEGCVLLILNIISVLAFSLAAYTLGQQTRFQELNDIIDSLMEEVVKLHANSLKESSDDEEKE